MSLERLRDFIRPISNAVLIGFIVLSALLCGILEAVRPGMGVRYAKGTGELLTAVPTDFYMLAGAGLVSYTAAREVGKYVKSKTRSSQQVDDPE